MGTDHGSPTNITIVSAHEGAATWVTLMEFIAQNSRYRTHSFHEYDDARYRAPKSRRARSLLRLKTFLIFPLRVLLHWRTLSAGADILVVVTSPFFLPILAAALPRPQRAHLVVLMNDIYPEALVARGVVKRGGAVERWLKRRFLNALEKCSRVVFISDYHRRFVLQGADRHSLVIPVSGHSDPFRCHEPRASEHGTHVTYCGTLGLMHETATFLSWLQHGTVPPQLQLRFFTSGAQKREFERAVERILGERGTDSVTLGDALGEEEWVGVMKDTQVGLVFQDKGSGNVIFPSKLASILVAGQAVLAIADKNSELGQLVLQHDCGWIVEPGDVDALDQCMQDIANSAALAAKRRNALALGRARFSKEATAARWIALFDDLQQHGSSTRGPLACASGAKRAAS